MAGAKYYPRSTALTGRVSCLDLQSAPALGVTLLITMGFLTPSPRGAAGPPAAPRSGTSPTHRCGPPPSGVHPLFYALTDQSGQQHIDEGAAPAVAAAGDHVRHELVAGFREGFRDLHDGVVARLHRVDLEPYDLGIGGADRLGARRLRLTDRAQHIRVRFGVDFFRLAGALRRLDRGPSAEFGDGHLALGIDHLGLRGCQRRRLLLLLPDSLRPALRLEGHALLLGDLAIG